jgi:hypothetical protein
MSFRPSALSNPQLALRPLPGRLPSATPRGVPGGIKVPGRAPVVPETISSGEGEAGEEGLPMAAKIAIGAAVAGALGFLVYRLVR